MENEEKNEEILETSTNEVTPVEGTIPVVGTENVVSSVQQQKKSHAGLIIGLVAIAVVGLVALGGGIFLVLSSVSLSGKKVIEKEVSLVFNEANKMLKESQDSILNYDLDKDSLGINGTLTVDSNYKTSEIDLTKLKNYKLEYSGVIDKKNNEAGGNIKLDDKTSNLIAIDGYIKGKKAIISLGDVFNKGISTELDKEIKELDLSKTDNTKDIKTLLEKTEKIVKNSIKDEDISKEKLSKEIDGKTIKVTKVEYKLNVNELKKEVITAYLDDPEIIKILANLSESTEKEVKANLKDYLDSLQNDTSNESITINVYLKGITKEIKIVEIIDDNTTLIINKDNDNYTYRALEDNKEIFTGEYNAKDKVFTLENKDAGVSIKITSEKTTKKVRFVYAQGEQKLIVDAIITNKVTKDKQDNKIVIKVAYKASSENIEATITNDLSIKKNATVIKVTKEPTVDIKEISDDDMLNMYSKLYEKLGKIVSDIVPSMGDTTDFSSMVG